MKDIYCSYYTNSEDIIGYMVDKLGVDDNDMILEPSAGEGIFIDDILTRTYNVCIDAIDMNLEAVSSLRDKYELRNNVNIYLSDTLLDDRLDKFENIGGYYDKIIGNPPYGAWQDYEKRNILKRKYQGHYVKETYTLFLLRCISLLKENGKLSFIIPDTFMFLNMHEKLRDILLTNTIIEEILIFPSKFFPGVSFGYSNLSIITLQKKVKSDISKSQIRILKGFQSSAEFKMLSDDKKIPSHIKKYYCSQEEILQNDKHRFMLVDNIGNSIFRCGKYTLGDVANIVTGFYTGNNLKYIRALNKNIKGASKYDVVDQNKIYECSNIKGISNVAEGYIPYVKCAPKEKYLRNNDEWFVRWDKKTIDFYNSNKKSRFQNSDYYFKTGIGIPMVKSSVVRAFLMQNRVFDQSIVGIFPKDSEKMLYILALMNSKIVNDIIHIINPTANNSANYIKQIPYIEPSKYKLLEITELVTVLLNCMEKLQFEKTMALEKQIDDEISNIYSIHR